MAKLFAFVALLISMGSHPMSMPKNPIVLVHGLLGGNHLGARDYFGDIPQVLRDKGAIVFIAELEQTAPSTVRGKRLYRSLKKWGYEKYNLIGHSQGGIDARYVLAKHSEIVASVTTVSSPHRGSKVADWLYEKMKSNKLKRRSMKLFGNAVGQTVGLLNGHWYHQDFEAAIKSLTTKSMGEFNRKYPLGIEDEAQSYTNLYSFGSESEGEQDVHDALGFLLEHVGEKVYGGKDNDGLVGVSSMKFGQWFGAIEHANHVMIVGGTALPVSDEGMRLLNNVYLRHAHILSQDGW